MACVAQLSSQNGKAARTNNFAKNFGEWPGFKVLAPYDGDPTVGFAVGQ